MPTLRERLTTITWGATERLLFTATTTYLFIPKELISENPVISGLAAIIFSELVLQTIANLTLLLLHEPIEPPINAILPFETNTRGNIIDRVSSIHTITGTRT